MTNIICEPIIDHKKPVYLACSGGVDSIAALYFIHARRKMFNVTAVHFNHNSRLENYNMSYSVRVMCDKFGIPLISGKLDKKKSIEHNGKEDYYRQHRIEFFKEKCAGGQLVLAHHLHDCIESYLTNALGGNPSYCPVPIITSFGDTKVIRPFMLNPKRNFIEYAKENNLMQYVVEDSTNTDTSIRRNKVRHSLIPFLEKEMDYKGEKTVARIMIEEYKKVKSRKDKI